MRRAISSFAVLLLLSSTILASDRPIKVKLKGLVCAFCARGLERVLSSQMKIQRYEINVPRGEVLLWPADDVRLSSVEIRDWVEKSGLALKEAASPQ